MSEIPDDSTEKRLQDMVDLEGSRKPEVPKDLEVALDEFTPAGHVDPTLAQRARAADVLKSKYVSELVELDLPDRLERINELSAEATDEAARSTFEVLYWFGETEWNYVEASLDAEPDNRIQDTTRWIIANAIARHEDSSSSQ